MMDGMHCPYLHCETTAFRRVGIDLGEPAQVSVTRVWYCRHPFHGLRLELGDARLDMEERCGACGLPKEQPDAGKSC
jgi:hypothetical protein